MWDSALGVGRYKVSDYVSGALAHHRLQTILNLNKLQTDRKMGIEWHERRNILRSSPSALQSTRLLGPSTRISSSNLLQTATKAQLSPHWPFLRLPLPS